MKNSLLTFAIVLCSLTVSGQQEAMYTHYAFNTLSVNPGYAGSREALTLTLLHRSQWVGFKGAPTTQTFTLHTPIRDNEMGIGLSAMNDRIGPVNNSSFYLDYAYKIPVYNGLLSAGLKGGLDIMQANLVGLAATDQNDLSIANNVRNEILPNFGLGVYYSTDRYYVGLSSPRLIQNQINLINMTSTEAIEKRHYYLIAGAIFRINENLQVKPMALAKVTAAAAAEVDFTGIVVLDEKYEFGAMYRTGDALGALFGINFDNNLRVGYSFDWSIGVQTGKNNAGSHELILRYDFIRAVRRKIVSPRHF